MAPWQSHNNVRLHRFHAVPEPHGMAPPHHRLEPHQLLHDLHGLLEGQCCLHLGHVPHHLCPLAHVGLDACEGTKPQDAKHEADGAQGKLQGLS